MNKYFSTTDILVIVITTILFVVAIFLKGFSKDLLLEAGVLLVSIKLILMNHKNAVTNEEILRELNDLKKTVNESNTNKVK